MWNQLTTSEQSFWNDLAKEYQGFYRIVVSLMESGTCPSCKFNFKNWPEFAHHYHSTHGIPEEAMLEIFKEKGVFVLENSDTTLPLND
jgi:hypothetical protein